MYKPFFIKLSSLPWMFGRPVCHETPTKQGKNKDAASAHEMKRCWSGAEKMASRVLGLCNGGDTATKRLMSPFLRAKSYVMLFSFFSQHLHGLLSKKRRSKETNEWARSQAGVQERKKRRNSKTHKRVNWHIFFTHNQAQERSHEQSNRMTKEQTRIWANGKTNITNDEQRQGRRGFIPSAEWCKEFTQMETDRRQPSHALGSHFVSWFFQKILQQ